MAKAQHSKRNLPAPANATAPSAEVITLTPWDEADPVANALLDLIILQNAVQATFNTYGEERDDGTFATDAELHADLDARAVAVMKLLAAQMAYWREFIPRPGPIPFR